MYLDITVTVMLNVAYCSCYVGYDMFQGFDVTNAPSFKPETKIAQEIENSTPVQENSTLQASIDLALSKFPCPEDENPSNIGPYEVPSRRDLVLFIKHTLVSMYNSYHKKALYLLKDIKQVTRATLAVEDKCTGAGTDRKAYRACVKSVSSKCEVITKTVVFSLEAQRSLVRNITEETICTTKLENEDPLQLIKTLAVEDVTLDFALPGFLRLLSTCSSYCKKKVNQTQTLARPTRHMTDQDLVVKHFLTKKNYLQLIQGMK